MKALPYFKWYPADAETDEFYTSLTDSERSFYHRCLNRSWINGGLPMDLHELAKAMNVSKKYLDKVWPKVSQKFQPNDGENPRMVNPRQEKEREEAIEKSNKASNSSAFGQSKGPGFIYLVARTRDGAVKIGSALSVPRRIAQLRYKYRDDGLELIRSFSVANMSEFEVRLHETYSDRRISGEWFRLSSDDLNDIAITLGGDTRGDNAYHPSYLPHARAYDYVSVSVSEVEEKLRFNKIPKNGSIASPTKERFDEWIKPWQRNPNEERAFHAWMFCWSAEDDGAIFACRDRYLGSEDVARGVWMNPERFLNEQKQNGWKGQWPPARGASVGNGAPRSRTEAMIDRAEELMREG